MTDELSDIKEQQINTNNNSKETSAGESRQQLLDAYAAAGLPLNFAWFHSISVEFSEISFKEKIGHGSYGVVYKAFWRDRYVAVKEFGPKTEQKAITTEVKQLSRVQHPNIIALYGIASNQMSTYLLMEYAEGGSLYDFLHGKVKPKYTAAHALNWALQCAEGVAYLHAMKPKPLIHRDLKPLNLLLTDKGRILKICDFGTVADKATLMTNNKGSAAWMAPEVFEGSKYTEKCDIFSWGIVLWEVLSRQKPFHDVDNTYSIMWKIHKGERPPLHPDFPEPLKDLMIACWKTKPELRPSMNYVVDVMNKMVLEFPGAEEPLEYEFINQQIISSNTGTTNGDNFTLNFSSFTSSNYSFKSSEITQESSINNTTSSTSTACEELNYSRHMQPVHTDAGVSRCWSIIPEESESTITNDCTSDIKEEFNLISTAESAQRYETIRNNMLQMASIPMTPLEIDIDPHTWDFNTSDSLLTKSDGKERLTVTDSKPLMIADKLSHRTIEELTPPINDDEINNLHKTKDQEEREVEEKSEQELDVEDSEDNCQSWHEMLDPELQPEPPLENNIESQEIYRKHKCLAKEYLKVDTDLYYAQDYKEKCLQELSPEERELKEDLIKKMNEKEELLELYNTLKQQLEVLRMGECGTESRSSVENAQPGNANCNNNNNELVTPDNWVVIDRNQNM